MYFLTQTFPREPRITEKDGSQSLKRRDIPEDHKKETRVWNWGFSVTHTQCPSNQRMKH